MKPPRFQYWAPESLAEALEGLWQLEDQGYTTKLLAGGQSLMPVLNMRLSAPDVIVDLNHLAPELSTVQEVSETLHIGAMTRHYQLESHPVLGARAPIIAEAERYIGHVAIRSRGTIGGSLVHADPSAELPLVLALLQGTVTLQSRESIREVSAQDFFVTYLTTAITSTEILTAITLPTLPPGSGQSLEEVASRPGDFAIVAAAAQVTLDSDEAIHAVRLALGGVSSVPLDVSGSIAFLVGEIPTAQLWIECTQSLADLVEPDSDVHADSAYRKDLTVALSRRALTHAWQRARQGASLGSIGNKGGEG